MASAVDIILKKLDQIEERLKKLETKNISFDENSANAPKIERDPLFPKALSIIDKYEEISASQLAKELGVDVKRAEKIMDELEEAGIGACYTKEV